MEQPDVATDFFGPFNLDVVEESKRLGAPVTLDIYFLVFLRRLSRFGFFSFGPINIDVRLIEDIVEATSPRIEGPVGDPPPMSEDMIAFSHRLMEELRRSGRRRLDEMHFLVAFMKTEEGLPGRVFGELGVTLEQVEAYARSQEAGPPQLEKLYSPEAAAEYLNVHVQTVRSWIRSGRLRAHRLAGQRALRIKASELQSVLEPLAPEDADQVD
jgi:excisionase family DNA binding protein